MKVSVFMLLASLPLLNSCSPKTTAASWRSASQRQEKEAQRVAEKIAGLLIGTCGELYYLADDPRPMRGYTVTAETRSLESAERFFGYDWKGVAIIKAEGETMAEGFDIRKIGGKWYLRAREGEGTHDYEVDGLRSVTRKCQGQNVR